MRGIARRRVRSPAAAWPPRSAAVRSAENASRAWHCPCEGRPTARPSPRAAIGPSPSEGNTTMRQDKALAMILGSSLRDRRRRRAVRPSNGYSTHARSVRANRRRSRTRAARSRSALSAIALDLQLDVAGLAPNTTYQIAVDDRVQASFVTDDTAARAWCCAPGDDAYPSISTRAVARSRYAARRDGRAARRDGGGRERLARRSAPNSVAARRDARSPAGGRRRRSCARRRTAGAASRSRSRACTAGNLSALRRRDERGSIAAPAGLGEIEFDSKLDDAGLGGSCSTSIPRTRRSIWCARRRRLHRLAARDASPRELLRTEPVLRDAAPGGRRGQARLRDARRLRSRLRGRGRGRPGGRLHSCSSAVLRAAPSRRPSTPLGAACAARSSSTPTTTSRRSCRSTSIRSASRSKSSRARRSRSALAVFEAGPSASGTCTVRTATGLSARARHSRLPPATHACACATTAGPTSTSQIEDVVAGSYDVVIGGVVPGTLTAAFDPGEGSGARRGRVRRRRRRARPRSTSIRAPR